MMIKFSVLSILIPAFIFTACKPDGVYDTQAIESLDKMCDEIGKFNSCSYTLNTFIMEYDSADSATTIINESDVYLRGPNKMHVISDGTKGEYGYWYDGDSLSFYSFDKNTYDAVDAPEGIVAAIDFLHDKYGIDFPATDFFYPTLTDDIIKHFDEVFYFDSVKIDEVACFMITGSNEKRNLRLWIDSETNLPYKVTLVGRAEKGNYYEGIFTNWRVDPALPDILFEFAPPSNATRVHIKEKSSK